MFGLFGSNTDYDRRIAKLERKVDAIIDQLQIELPSVPEDNPAFRDKIRSIAQTEGKIAAVAEYKRVAACSLMEAKQEVEAMMKEGPTL